MKKIQCDDTEYLLSSPSNAASLAESVKQYRRGKKMKAKTVSIAKIGHLKLSDLETGIDSKTGEPISPAQQQAIDIEMKKVGASVSGAMSSMNNLVQSCIQMIDSTVLHIQNKAIEPLRLLLAAGDLYKALKADDGVTVARIMASPDFDAHFLQLLVRWTEMNEEERTEAVAQQLTEIKMAGEEKKQITSKKNKENASKPRLADKKHTKEIFEKWNGNPKLYKNKAAFKRDILSKEFCKDSGTVDTWVNEFRDEITLSDGLRKLLDSRSKTVKI